MCTIGRYVDNDPIICRSDYAYSLSKMLSLRVSVYIRWDCKFYKYVFSIPLLVFWDDNANDNIRCISIICSK